MRPWFLYLIECRGGSVYTGIAVDVAKRYAQHLAGTGARYTRSRPPLRLLAVREYPDRSTASRAEHAVKRLTPGAKRSLASGGAPWPAFDAPALAPADAACNPAPPARARRR